MAAHRDHETITLDETVTQEWQDAHLATVFSKWHDYVEPAQRESAEALIAEAGIAAGDHVLDVACGSGTPALRAARAVGQRGSVTALDPSPIFLDAIRENARKLGLSNLTAVQGSAGRLSFAPGAFDAVTCHMGVMFFPNITSDLRNIRRVLKPGRRAAFVAWGPPEENQLFGAFWGVVRPLLPPDANAFAAGPPDPAVPTPVRFSRSGTLSAELRKAEYDDVRERAIEAHMRWPGTPEQHLEMWLELTGVEDQVPADRHEELRSGVIASYRRFQQGNELVFSIPIVVASGRA
jgi:ubiquinone/menaquinone biosynthesis C-methylase UbiE